jgi:hypothetical protein
VHSRLGAVEKGPLVASTGTVLSPTDAGSRRRAAAFHTSAVRRRDRVLSHFSRWAKTCVHGGLRRQENPMGAGTGFARGKRLGPPDAPLGTTHLR